MFCFSCCFVVDEIIVNNPKVWHSGTLANGLVGSTRRIPIKEIEAPSPAAAAAEAAEAVEAEEEGETRIAGSSSTLKDSDTMWLEVDSGGDLLVRGKGVAAGWRLG